MRLSFLSLVTDSFHLASSRGTLRGTHSDNHVIWTCRIGTLVTLVACQERPIPVFNFKVRHSYLFLSFKTLLEILCVLAAHMHSIGLPAHELHPLKFTGLQVQFFADSSHTPAEVLRQKVFRHLYISAERDRQFRTQS
ncbi:hypothetical protein K435DRAFT_239807 [Dendrothele bispora CBS 962.96]|uniref:Uncharacterized protein n=1 Tax=Dendrothele bispora (strain CBS 962.96) TaxID=1314807 RepID=A0A4S8MM66_DENBC|nr:hypothetical protein K435DRAFT_239807 [Dendrothele bispora CBS 962.96]